MFLHSGAAMHGHEYSPSLQPRAVASLPRRSTLSRVTFAATTHVPRRSASFDHPMPILHSEKAFEAYSERTDEPFVHFHKPEADVMSEDGRSVTNSETSTTVGGPRSRKRLSRTTTSYSLAHPAPTLGQKQKLIIVRPRLLLQLQRLSVDARPKPAIDVLPSTVVVSRLVKKFPRLFRGKGGLGPNDVMIVKSEEYGSSDVDDAEETDSDEDSYGSREVLAVICQMRKDEGGAQGVAEIVLTDGAVWTARPMSNGLYEFTCTDQHGIKTTARWVKRNTQRSSMDYTTKGPNPSVKFTFSIMTRTHDAILSWRPSLKRSWTYQISIPRSHPPLVLILRHPPSGPLPEIRSIWMRVPLQNEPFMR